MSEPYTDLRSPHVRGLYMISGVCGLVDAACFLALGAVFAEMMTGNLLLFFFNVGTGQSPFEHAAYLMALAAFAVGAVCGGRVVRSAYGQTRLGFMIEWVLLAVAVALSMVVPLGADDLGRDIVISILAVAMGLQNALLRKHGVPDLATNVMTLTMTALVAESRASGGAGERWQRRFGSIATFALCALIGAALTTRVGPWASLALALVLFSVALAGLTRQRA
jgi:uncharacterized membrane protein YoaK (UPF0700 family)